MTKAHLLGLLFLTAISGCDQIDFLSDKPSNEELKISLSSQLSGHPVLDASVLSCQSGISSNNSKEKLQICKICLVVVAARNTGDLFAGGETSLIVGRGHGNAVFHRAVSVDHPEILPANGAKGVWVISKGSLKVESPDDKNAWLPKPLVQRAGFEPRTGFNALMSSGGISEKVQQNFATDDVLRQQVINLVGGCNDKQYSKPVLQSNSSASPLSSQSKTYLSNSSYSETSSASDLPASKVTILKLSPVDTKSLSGGFGCQWYIPSIYRRRQAGGDGQPIAATDFDTVLIGLDGRQIVANYPDDQVPEQLPMKVGAKFSVSDGNLVFQFTKGADIGSPPSGEGSVYPAQFKLTATDNKLINWQFDLIGECGA